MNRDTLGYTITLYGKNDGCAATWCETLEDAMHEALSMSKGNHEAIAIVKTPYKSRMKRFIVERPKFHNDAGIITKKTKGEKS